MRYRITFSKTPAMRYIGHLDLYRAWERLIRRAALPLAYTQGYSPHPRINLASALPLGFTSHAELIDLWLDADLPVDSVHAALSNAAPPGLLINHVQTVPERAPALQAILIASDFEITLLEPVADLDERLHTLLARPELPRQRRGKPYDLRPLIFSVSILLPDPHGRQRLLARLAAREAATGRPEELLAELSIDPLSTRVERLALVFTDD